MVAVDGSGTIGRRQVVDLLVVAVDGSGTIGRRQVTYPVTLLDNTPGSCCKGTIAGLVRVQME